MEIPDTMIDDAFKKTTRYMYYKAKKVESKKANVVVEPEEQNISSIRSGRRKGYMRSGKNEANVPKLFKKNDVPRKTRSLTVVEETVAVEHPKFVSIKESRTQQCRRSQLTIDSQIDEDVAHTYAEWGRKLKGPTVDDQAVRHYFMSRPVYTNAQTTSVVHNPEGHPELTSYISGASKVPFGTHVDVLAIKTLLQEMFSGEADHYKSSPPANTTYLPIKTPQPSSLQDKVKKLIQKEKKNMRKINFKKVITQKFRDYDQKLEALTNFNVSEAFEKAVQARVLTEIKKLLPNHIPKAVENYVRPRLNNSMLEVMQNNQISQFTKSSTSKLYDTLYESILHDQEALDVQETEPSFHKRTYNHQDPPIDREGEKRRKDKRMLVNHLLKPQEKINLLWFKLKKTLMLINPKTTQTFLFINTLIQDGLPRSRAKKIKEIIQKDRLIIADLEGAGLNKLKLHYKNEVELEYHVNQLKGVVVFEA
nr:hypothetical protein [Tanacetum cinerariifolium]